MAPRKVATKNDIEAVEKSAASSIKKKTEPEISDNTIVEVKSLIPFVYYTCLTTHEEFEWLDAGDICEMTFKQLKIMKTKHPRYFSEKWLMPCDEEVIDKLKIRDLYTNNLRKQDMEKFYGNNYEEAEIFIDTLNEEALESLKSKVIAAVKSETMSNAKMIRLLERKLDLDLMQYL